MTTAVIDSSLGPVRSFSDDGLKGRERLHHLFKQTFPRFQEFEPQLRAAAQLALEQWALRDAAAGAKVLRLPKVPARKRKA